jgi:RND family efflux transporter MFP subunit
MKRNFIFLFSVLLLACSSTQEIKPVIKDIRELVFASGQLEWDNAYNLTAQTDGILENADFEIGNKVSKGIVLANIDNKINEINANISREQLAIANENISENSPVIAQLKENIVFAESKYQQDKLQEERSQRLFETESIARVDLENAQLNAKNSLANLNGLKKQLSLLLQQAKQQYGNSNVIKEFNKILVTESGTIIKKIKTNGDYVRKGDVIATIANDQKIEAVLNVDENSIGKIKQGQLVYIKLNTEKSRTYIGKVSEILSAFDQSSQSFICKVVFETPVQASLYGTQLEANILVGEKKNALLVPRNYVGYGNKVNIKGKDDVVIIVPGIISTEYVEVLSGISKNDVLLPLKP